MATEAPTKKKPASKKKDEEAQQAQHEQAADGAISKAGYEPPEDEDDDDDLTTVAAVVNDDSEEATDAEEAIEVFDPLTEPRRWVIGKPPELGGKETEYSVYVQDTLGYMPRIRFFALVANTIAKAMKAGVDLDVPGLDLSTTQGMSLRERAQLMTQGSLDSGADFMHLALQLVAYSPSFLLQCYVLWLDVPRDERGWAMDVMSQPWNPSRGKYGLKDEEGMLIIETFIDQNYEDIRKFFTRDVPLLLRRAQRREEEHKDRESTSGRSKP